MDPLSSRLFFASSGSAPLEPVVPQHVAVIDAEYEPSGPSTVTGLGTYTGVISTPDQRDQSAFRFGGFTGSKFFELQLVSGSNSGFSGICDGTHWDAGPAFGSFSGERAAQYHEYDFSFGERTGTTLISGQGAVPSGPRILGYIWNESSGRIAFYQDGVLKMILENTALIGQTKYVIAQLWFVTNTSYRILTTPSAYAGFYQLP